MDDGSPRAEPTLAVYDGDIVAWANQQAALLRAGRFTDLDIEHIADEVEDVGKSERRELSSRMTILLAHLLKWQMQPERRVISGKSWRDTIRVQREDIADHLAETPSLKPSLRDPTWMRKAWRNGIVQTTQETGIGLDDLPANCPWSIDEILDPAFLPA